MTTVPSLGFFNARHLGAEDAARSFTPNAKFKQLVGLQNSLLVGARGSGKTHLLKMLQPKALNAWEHQDAEEIRRKITYWGVFGSRWWSLESANWIDGGLSPGPRSGSLPVRNVRCSRSTITYRLLFVVDPRPTIQWSRICLGPTDFEARVWSLQSLSS